MNREQWLNDFASKYLLPKIAAAGYCPPTALRVSVGFPKGSRGGRGAHAVGQCWSPIMSSDGHTEMFVSPVLDDFHAVVTLLHELVHAVVGVQCGHRGAFKKLALRVGLSMPMRSTPPSDALRAEIVAWLAEFAAYPHGPMSEVSRPDGKKPGSRLIKAMCPACGYTVRVSRQWLDIAPPVCPDPDCDSCGEPMQEG